MKKITYCLVMIVVLALFSNVVLAAETASFGIALSSTKTQVNPGDEITVTLKLKDLKNMTGGLYSFLATIEYDEDFFETLTQDNVKGLGTWSSVPTFNSNNGQIVADSGLGVNSESDVFSITFKVKETAETGKSTQIVVKNFEASEGEEDLLANEDAKITINVVQKDNDDNTDNTGSDNTENDNTGNTDNNADKEDNNNNNNSGNNNNSDENKDDSTTTDNKLPQTGESTWIILSSIVVITGIAIASYKSYKKYANL